MREDRSLFVGFAQSTDTEQDLVCCQLFSLPFVCAKEKDFSVKSVVKPCSSLHRGDKTATEKSEEEEESEP